ncbi:MAG: TRAP transporter substrate-binding protein DctP [Thermodesulfobacteriota bacterium]
MKKGVLLRFAMMVALATAVFPASFSQAGEKTAIKIATLAPKDVGWSITFNKLINPWFERATENHFVIKPYWGGVMGNDDDYLRKMKIGQLQGAGLSGQGSNNACPEFSVLGLPLLFNNYEEVDYIRFVMQGTFDDFFAQNGYKLLLWIDQDFDLFYSSKFRFDKMTDFRMARIATWYGPQEAAMLEALGASPIPSPVTDGPTLKRTGIVDTNIAPAIFQVGAQLYTIDKYVNTMKIRYSPATVVFSNEMWAQIPEKYQNNLMAEQADIQKLFCADIRKDNEKCLKAMVNYGIVEVTPPPDVMAEIQRRVMKVYNDMSGKLYPVELLKEVRRYLAAYRQKKPQKAEAVALKEEKSALGEEKAILEEIPRVPEESTETEKEVETGSAAQEKTNVSSDKASAWEKRKKEIMEAQKILQGMGFYKAGIDGIAGPETRNAILEYQKTKGLPETGSISKNLLRQMGIIE